jgi:hypothetical protein
MAWVVHRVTDVKEAVLTSDRLIDDVKTMEEEARRQFMHLERVQEASDTNPGEVVDRRHCDSLCTVQS